MRPRSQPGSAGPCPAGFLQLTAPLRSPGMARRYPTPRAETCPAAVAHPHMATRVDPAAAFLAGTAGQLLLQHRAALALIPVAGLRAVVVAAAGHRVIAVSAAPATAATAPATGFGEFGTATATDPDRAIAHAPGTPFVAGAARQLADQAGIAPADRAAALTVVLALAADGLAGPAVVAAPATAIAAAPATAGLDELRSAAVGDPDAAVTAAPGSSFITVRAGQLAHQLRIAPAGVADPFAVVLAFAADHAALRMRGRGGQGKGTQGTQAEGYGQAGQGQRFHGGIPYGGRCPTIGRGAIKPV